MTAILDFLVFNVAMILVVFGLLAQVGGGYSIVQIVIILIIVFAVIAIGLVALRAFGIQVPAWLTQIIIIVVVAIVAIAAIKFLVSAV